MGNAKSQTGDNQEVRFTERGDSRLTCEHGEYFTSPTSLCSKTLGVLHVSLNDSVYDATKRDIYRPHHAATQYGIAEIMQDA